MRSTFLVLFFSPFFLLSQNIIALHHNGQTSFFTEIQAAYEAVTDGDTLYLPGGFHSGLNLTKSIYIIGAGYNPDSTKSTAVTITGQINFLPGSSGSYITGIFVAGVIGIDEDPTVSNITIRRCYISNGLFCGGFNHLIAENVIGPYGNYCITGRHSKYNLFSNNIVVGGLIIDIDYSEISNNIFFPNNYFLSNLVGGGNCIIKNNIFGSTKSYINQGSSFWYNNLNDGVNDGGITGDNNILNTPPLYVNFTGPGFSFDDNFHLVGNYLGTDGEPIGIYGGRFPWKGGGVPFNPHIQLKDIAPQTDADGNLHVKVRVSAQGN